MRPEARVRIYSDEIRKTSLNDRYNGWNIDDTFDDFLALGYKLRLNLDLLDTWREMVTADVLIMSRSEFSFVPALLSRGVVVYYPMWHSALPHWSRLECSPNVTVSEDHCAHITDPCVRWEEAANLCRLIRCSEAVCPKTEIPEGQPSRASFPC